ncbi:MAG: Ig-like domain-containing protein, partial [Clostridiales bacterium]|nr:Ig-like domain-containing protein [Clostridiales bacterium]
MTGIEWVGDETSGYTGAVANYKCTKDGVTDYTKQVPMDISSDVTAASCDVNGKTVYTAKLSALEARDGKALVSDPVSLNIPLAKGHKWGEWKVSTPATVEKPGTKTRSCSVCGKTETADIAKLTPTPTTKPAAGPTKTSEPSVSLTLNKTKAEVVCGKNLTLKATLKGSSAKITWKSSDTKVATVDSNGKITAKMAGTVTITATSAGKAAICTVTVLYKDVTNSKDFWYAPTNYLTAKGVVKGYDKQTKFKPANVCTRAQMVTFIWRL